MMRICLGKPRVTRRARIESAPSICGGDDLGPTAERLELGFFNCFAQPNHGRNLACATIDGVVMLKRRVLGSKTPKLI